MYRIVAYVTWVWFFGWWRWNVVYPTLADEFTEDIAQAKVFDDGDEADSYSCGLTPNGWHTMDHPFSRCRTELLDADYIKDAA